MPQSRHSWQFRLASWLTLLLLSYTIAIPSAESRTNPPKKPPQTSSPRANPPKKKSPRKTLGLGGRGNCPEVIIPLTALLPVAAPTSNSDEPPRDMVLTDRPTFWFYVPYSPNFRLTAEFVLIDSNENDVYATTFLLKERPGIIGIPLPQKVSPLQVNQSYTWVFSMICDPNNRSGDVSVYGTIERISVPSTLQTQLTQARTIQEKTILHTRNGLWNEAVTNLARLQRANLTDKALQNEWKRLLQALGLNQLDAAPLTPCCTPEADRKP